MEDGKLAPCGTHLRPTKPAAAPIKASVSFSSLPAPSAVAAVTVPVATPAPSASSDASPAVASNQHQLVPVSAAPAVAPTSTTNNGEAILAAATQRTAGASNDASNGAQVHTSMEPPQPMFFAYAPPAVTYGQFHSGAAYHQTMSCTPADFAAMLAGNGTSVHPAANDYHLPPPASYAPTVNGAKLTATMVDPRIQKKQSAPATATAGMDPSFPFSTDAGHRPPNLTIPSIPVRNGMFPYAVGNQNMVGGRQPPPLLENRVKIPLPLGATDPRDLIPVNAYTNHQQMTFLAQPPPPQLYGYNRSVSHTLHQQLPQHQQHTQRVPQEAVCHYDQGSNGAGAGNGGTQADFPHNHVSYDSVGFHSFDAAQPGQVAAMLPQAISSLGAVANSASNKNAAPPSGTFRLGPRGSITKN